MWKIFFYPDLCWKFKCERSRRKSWCIKKWLRNDFKDNCDEELRCFKILNTKKSEVFSHIFTVIYSTEWPYLRTLNFYNVTNNELQCGSRFDYSLCWKRTQNCQKPWLKDRLNRLFLLEAQSVGYDDVLKKFANQKNWKKQFIIRNT